MLKRLVFVICALFSVRTLAETTPGVTDTEVLIGTHTVDSGNFAMYSQVGSAMAAYYEMVNEKGGVDGRKIKMIRVDTRLDAGKTQQAVRQFVEQDKVFAVVGGVGPSHNVAYKYLIEKNVPDVFMNDGASFYTNPPNKVVFPATFSFVEEGKALGNYLIKNYPGKKLCFMSIEAVHGKEIPQGMLEVIEQHNKSASAKDKISIGPTESTDRNAVQGDAEVARLKEAKCEVVLLTSAAALNAAEINYGARHDFKPKWMTFRFNANDKYLSLVDEGARDGIVVTTFVATGENSKVAGWADFKKLMEKNKIPVSGISAMGYQMAETFVQSLREAAKQGHTLTRESYLKGLEGFNGWKCSICYEPVKFSAENHWPLKPTVLVSKSGHWDEVESK